MSREDYSWMLLPNTDPAWHVGFEKFIEHTFEGTYVGDTTTCTCGMCRGMAYMTKVEVEEHLIRRGFDQDFIKIKTVRAAESVEDDACNFSEGGDEGCVSNLLNSLISGACRGEIIKDEPNDAVLAFLMPKRISIPQAHRITAVTLHLGVFQGIVISLGKHYG